MKEGFGPQEEAAATQWDARYRETKAYLEEDATPLVKDFFEKYGAKFKGGKVLDIGCGNGRNLRYIARRGYDSYGTDISEEALLQLQEKLRSENLPVHIARGSFYNLPYKDETFDCAVSNNVFQHNDFEGARRSFSEGARVLKPDGIFFVSVRSESRELPASREDVPDRGTTFIPKEGSKAGIKIHHYSEEEIRDLANENGLEILEMKEVIREKDENSPAGGPNSERKGHWIVVFRKRK